MRIPPKASTVPVVRLSPHDAAESAGSGRERELPIRRPFLPSAICSSSSRAVSGDA